MTGENDPNEGAQLEPDLELGNDTGESLEHNMEFLALRKTFFDVIGGAGNAIFQPILKRLGQFQNWEQKKEIGWTRKKCQDFFGNGNSDDPEKQRGSEAYRKIDKVILTYFSIFGPHALVFLLAQTGIQIDESTKQAFFENMAIGLTAGFGLDTVGHTIADGSSYWFRVEDKITDDKKPDEKESDKTISLEAAPLINLGAMGGSMSEVNLEILRMAKLLRVTKMSKVALATKSWNIQNSLEDESSNKISKDFTKLIVMFTAAMAAMTTAKEFDYTEWQDIALEFGALGFLIYKIRQFNQGVRKTIAHTFTKRFKEADERILQSFMDNPQLSFLADAYQKSGNEIELFENRISTLFSMNEELINPLGEEVKMVNGVPVNTEVKRACVFTDVRNWTAMNEKYPASEIAVVLGEYISELYLLAKKHGGRLGKLMGDGALILFRDDKDEPGYKEGDYNKTKEEKVVDFSIEFASLSNKYDKIFSEEFPLDKDTENTHKTGVGMKSGDISVANLFPKKDGKPLPFRNQEAIGNTLNRAARLEAANKEFPGHALLITQDDYEKLPEHVRGLFHQCGQVKLKGLGLVDVYGLPEKTADDILKKMAGAVI